jgi:ABC-type lipoprotein release transport system permease subunit
LLGARGRLRGDWHRRTAPRHDRSDRPSDISSGAGGCRRGRCGRGTRRCLPSAWRLSYAARLAAGVAAVSLLLAAIGVYGVLTHAVGERTREIGLRVALGARARHVSYFVLRHAIVSVVVGVCAGLAVSSLLVDWLRVLLFGVEPVDALTFAAVAVVLAGVALAAAIAPLRRALTLEPLRALRHE